MEYVALAIITLVIFFKVANSKPVTVAVNGYSEVVEYKVKSDVLDSRIDYSKKLTKAVDTKASVSTKAMHDLEVALGIVASEEA